MYSPRRRFGSASRTTHVAPGGRCSGCFGDCATCARPGGAGGASCPTWIPADLVTALNRNANAVDIASAATAYIASVLVGSVFLAPLAVPLGAVALVLTSLGNNCDLGASMQSTARQAAIGCKVGAVAAGAASIIPGAVLIAGPIGLLLGALAPIMDALGAGKAPKLADVGNFSGLAAAAGGLNQSSIPAGLGPLASMLPALSNNTQIKALVPQVATASQSTSTDVDSAWFATVRKAIVGNLSAADNPNAGKLDTALAPFVAVAKGNRNYGRFKVMAFLGDWVAAGRPGDVNAIDVWDKRINGYPFTERDRAEVVAKGKSYDATQAAKHLPPLGPKVNLGGLSHLMTGALTPTKPSTPIKAPMSTHAKVAAGGAALAALFIAAKVLL